MISLARDLGASRADQERIRTDPVAGLGDVADRVWRLLDAGASRWLLVLDDVDDPELLGPPDGRGWLRPARTGLLLVTSRNGDETAWPGGASFVPVGPLPVAAAADVLAGLAPSAGGPAGARALAKRLGCLPLALRMAGMHLRRDFAAWPTFEATGGRWTPGVSCPSSRRRGRRMRTP